MGWTGCRWQDTRLPHSRQAANTSARMGGRFLGPDMMLRMRSSVSRAELDRGVEKGVWGMLSFIAISFLSGGQEKKPSPVSKLCRP